MINCNPIMPMEQKEIEGLIKTSLPDAEVTITDLAGDNNHFSAHITSALFEGKSRIQQHKMVYDALEGRMGGILHALSLKTSAKKD